jgi:hypothetical protein
VIDGKPSIPSVPASADAILSLCRTFSTQHPVTIIFHLLFKSLAIFIYVFGSWITTNFIFTFVICIVLLAFDFWTVKNISGKG